MRQIDRDHSQAGVARLFVYIAFLFAVWLVVGRYWGVRHDALGYMLQAVSKIQPVPLADDIFLRYRSQEEFTFFPELCAPIIAWIGIDKAGAGLTLIFSLVWLVAAWLLARRLFGTGIAWLAVALLLLTPRWYGAYHIFRLAEPFFSARLPAEALSLGAILAFANDRRLLSWLMIAAAAAIHPIMAMPVALLVALATISSHSIYRLTAAGALILAGAIIGSVVLGTGPKLLSPEWLAVTRVRSPFLFMDQWTAVHWELTVITLTTVWALAQSSTDRTVRRIAATCLIVALVGLLLTLVSSTLLPAKLLLQGQPWRWIWPARFLAIIALPAVLYAMWNSNRPGRAAGLLICGAWMIADSGSAADIPPIGVGGFLAIAGALIWVAKDRVSARIGHLIEGFSWSAIILVAIQAITSSATDLFVQGGFGPDPLWLQAVTAVLKQTTIAMFIAGLAWWICFRSRGAWNLAVLLGSTIAVAVAAAPVAFQWWTSPTYGAERRSTFESWRAAIPRDKEVLWPIAPSAVWFILDRKSYLTIAQSAGVVFSEETSKEVLRRAAVLAPWVSPGYWLADPEVAIPRPFADLTPQVLKSICKDRNLGFVVSELALGSEIASAEWPTKARYVHLYDCRTFRD